MDRDQVRDAIVKGLRDQDVWPDDVIRDIAFHMTDWIDDLPLLVSFYETPDSLSADEVYHLLGKFLLHAPNHLAAAVKLYTGDPLDDVFGIGATVGTGQPDG